MLKGYECKIFPGITQCCLENMNGAEGRLQEKIVTVVFVYTIFG
jgi:hypothetical protein